MTKITKLHVFDLDETLFRMPGYTSKKHSESDLLKFNTPYEFYDHPESLCEETHNIQLIAPVYECYREAALDPKQYVVLITHRVEELKNKIFSILIKRNIDFDDIFFLGRKTKKSKTLAKILDELPDLEEVHIYEDSIAQLDDYQNFFDTQQKLGISMPKLTMYIVDKSKMYIIENISISNEKRIKLI
jgi:hypothetical protein